jgi:hypothetical protein
MPTQAKMKNQKMFYTIRVGVGLTTFLKGGKWGNFGATTFHFTTFLVE